MAKIKNITSIVEDPEARQSKTTGLLINYEDGTRKEIEFKQNQPLNFEFERLTIDVLWVNLQGSNFKGCDFFGSKIKQSNFDRSDFSWCNFQGARLCDGSSVSECNFEGANFIGSSILTVANINWKTNVAGAIFVDVSIPEGVNEDDINGMKRRGAIMDRSQLRGLLDEMKELNNDSQIDRTKAIQYLSILKNFAAIKGLKYNIRTEIEVDENGEERLLTIHEPVIGEDDEKTLREKFGSLVNNGVVGKIMEEKEQGFVDDAQKIKAINTASVDKIRKEMPMDIMSNIAAFLPIPIENKTADKNNKDDSYKALTNLGRMLFEKAGFLAPRTAVAAQNADPLQQNQELQH